MKNELSMVDMLDKIQTLKDTKKIICEEYDMQITALTSRLEMMLDISGEKELKTDLATAYWQKNTQVEVKDWNVVMEFVAKNNAFDILQKRISPAQLKARLDAGAVIKGVSVKDGKTFMIRGRKE